MALGRRKAESSSPVKRWRLGVPRKRSNDKKMELVQKTLKKKLEGSAYSSLKGSCAL
jgi:hypothetical protein